MKLSDWMIKNNLTCQQFAQSICANKTHINRIYHEIVIPGEALAFSIQQATKGEVTVEELRANFVRKKKPEWKR